MQTNPVNKETPASHRAMPKHSLIKSCEYHEDSAGSGQRRLEWHLIWRLLGYTKPYAGKRNVLFVLTSLRALQLPTLALAVGAIISGPIAGGNFKRAVWAIAVYASLALVTEFTVHFRLRLALELGELVVRDLRKAISEHIQTLSMSFFHRTKLGGIINCVNMDVEAVRLGIQNVAFTTVEQLGAMFASACYLAYKDIVLFLMILCVAPVLWTLDRRFRHRIGSKAIAMQESGCRVTATVTESVGGIRVTQSFVRQETNSGLFRTLISDHSKYGVAWMRACSVLAPLIEINSQMFMAILLLAGGWRVLHGATQLADLIAFFFLINFFLAPIQEIGIQYNQALLSMASAERIFRLIDAKPDWVDDPLAEPLSCPPRGGCAESGVEPTPVASPNSQTGGAKRASMIKPKTKSAGMNVQFKDVTFAYESGRSVLNEISFISEPGQIVALVGHTGGGKSTIVNLTSKFYLHSVGDILIDGKDIRLITSDSLHKQMAIVPQQSFLFTGTVLENLRFGRPEATEREVIEATNELGWLDLLASLPDGLQTEVGEKGRSISAGQRQLICFTRAYLAKPRLLILDEATSAVDPITEMRLHETLRRVLQNRTSFVVAHRLSTVRSADLVLVIEHGRIVERGSHVELLARGRAYSSLYRQFVQID